MQKEEIWKKIKGFENYEASSLGRVKSLKRQEWCKRNNSYKIRKETILKKCLEKTGYHRVCLYNKGVGKLMFVHQIISIAFLNHTPCGHELVVNHINFDKIDNSIENLEIVTARENSNKKHLKSSSKYTGVCWNKRDNKWMASMLINGKRKFLGYFDSELEAHKAYEKYKTNNSLI